MPQIRYHGGQCCGIRHISGFYGLAPKITESLIPPGGTHALSEIVLTDDQLLANNRAMVKQLKKFKFYLVVRVQNPNTRNYINVFHRLSGRRKDLSADSPFNQEEV